MLTKLTFVCNTWSARLWRKGVGANFASTNGLTQRRSQRQNKLQTAFLRRSQLAARETENMLRRMAEVDVIATALWKPSKARKVFASPCSSCSRHAATFFIIIINLYVTTNWCCDSSLQFAMTFIKQLDTVLRISPPPNASSDKTKLLLVANHINRLSWVNLQSLVIVRNITKTDRSNQNVRSSCLTVDN